MTGQTPEQTAATHAGDAAAAVLALADAQDAQADLIVEYDLLDNRFRADLHRAVARDLRAVVAALPQPATDTLAAVRALAEDLRRRAVPRRRDNTEAQRACGDLRRDTADRLLAILAGDAGAGQTGADQ